ncbi:murein transglycosylase A [Actibacterium sp. XHP0104]|uniref:murein transglycosylase A n=1 Tax=Actibacterium sp. XHP0104 TaxID=2984335 RepID=UPI0021E7AD5E|nr:MltA domain-containing protein [Actibacterium sp. XHP0104]MCV2882112.1 MltA domain-containing protein [Actibacterium sp. XHP0104]
MIGALRSFAAAVAVTVAGAVSALGATAEILRFDDLEGWADDDHAAAFAVFLNTCGDLDADTWGALCAYARSGPDPRAFFELFFRPVLIGGEQPALFTGYFEPELNGARNPDARFRYPIYRTPPGLTRGQKWHSRAEIENNGLLRGQGLEIAWVDDPVDVFFLQIQGSGRIRLRDGNALRVGYGGANGHEYRSVGQELVRRGVFQPHQVSAQVIRNWVRNNPRDGRELLQHNPSYVFFRRVTNVPAHLGPLGAMNRSITQMRTVAVDPAFTPLGAPVWIEKGGRGPLRRLMVAQDTGSAIKGPQRADIFFGTGDQAGRNAGAVRDAGRMVVLLPIDQAFALAPGG